jgi:hypothetical protein
MKIACAFLIIGASVATFGQADLSKQSVAAKAPFTLTISCSATHPASENPHDNFVVSGVAMSVAHISDDPKSDVVKSNIITVTVLPEPDGSEPK